MVSPYPSPFTLSSSPPSPLPSPPSSTRHPHHHHRHHHRHHHCHHHGIMVPITIHTMTITTATSITLITTIVTIPASPADAWPTRTSQAWIQDPAPGLPPQRSLLRPSVAWSSHQVSLTHSSVFTAPLRWLVFCLPSCLFVPVGGENPGPRTPYHRQKLSNQDF